ncbi:hypothetical protein [Desulfonatronovibrio magnus]|uniref:hypothetical protein n=1 Tax=Desulfonatronovibrio magnus TaxID=698827 RepID=UPI0005EAEB77|nr:hypothetical protein [Desulfonatronovibrio magnus]
MQEKTSLNLYEEFLHIIRLLNRENISYALCGGLAMAVYDLVRATVDIDLLILTKDLSRAMQAVEGLGFDIKAQPMVFAQGKVCIHRVSKIDPGMDYPLSIDFLLVNEDLEWVWLDRKRIEMEEDVWVVSQPGLICLKEMRDSAQDQEDIRQLRKSNEKS